MRKLLTIGVPAYNVEKYLPRCLDSVLDDRVEVLVINDGSTDTTEKIALDYQSRYPGIIRVISKPNGGWGSGVNLAIREAAGEYFKNLDSDDWFDKKGLSALLSNMERHKVDVMASPAVNYAEETGDETPLQFPNGCVFGEELPFEELEKKIDFVFRMHSLAYRTELLQSRNVRVDECYYSDTELAAFPFEYAKTVYVQPEPVYIYRVGRSGQSMSLPSMAKHMKDIERVSLRFCDKIRSLEGNNAYLERYAKIVLSSLFTQPMAIEDKAERALWYDKIRSLDVPLSGREGYSIYANLVMKSDFRPSPVLVSLWRFSMGRGARLTDKIWNILRKL